MVNFINQQRSLNNPCQFPDAEFYVDGFVSGARLTSLYKTSSYIRARAEGFSYISIAAWDSNIQAYIPRDAGLRLIVTGGADSTNDDFVEWYLGNTHPSETDFVYKASDLAVKATADAIRSKSGTSDLIRWDYSSGFKSAIDSIYKGNDTRNTTAYASDLAEGATAASKGKEITGTIPLARGCEF